VGWRSAVSFFFFINFFFFVWVPECAGMTWKRGERRDDFFFSFPFGFFFFSPATLRVCDGPKKNGSETTCRSFFFLLLVFLFFPGRREVRSQSNEIVDRPSFSSPFFPPFFFFFFWFFVCSEKLQQSLKKSGKARVTTDQGLYSSFSFFFVFFPSFFVLALVQYFAYCRNR